MWAEEEGLGSDRRVLKAPPVSLIALVIMVLAVLFAPSVARGQGQEEILYPLPSRDQLYPGAKSSEPEKATQRRTPTAKGRAKAGKKTNPASTPAGDKSSPDISSTADNGPQATEKSKPAAAATEASPPPEAGGESAATTDVRAKAEGEKSEPTGGMLGVGAGEALDTSPIRTGFINPGADGGEAAGLETGSPLDQWDPWRALGWVVAILGLLIIFASLVRRMNAGRLLGLSGAGLSIVEALNLGQGRQILVVRTPDEDLILGVTRDSITLLSTVPRVPRELRQEMERIAREEARLAAEDEWQPTAEAEARRFARRVMFEGERAARPSGGEELSPAGRRFLEKLSEKLSQWEV